MGVRKPPLARTHALRIGGPPDRSRPIGIQLTAGERRRPIAGTTAYVGGVRDDDDSIRPDRSRSHDEGHSTRIARSGSTFAACRLGITQASIATAVSVNATMAIVGGSMGVTP